MLHYIVLFVALCGCLGQSNGEQYENPTNQGGEKLAIDILSTSGLRAQFPFFSPNVTSIEPQLKDMLMLDITEVLGMVQEVIDKVLVDDTGKGWLSSVKPKVNWPAWGGRLFMMGRKQSARRKALNMRPGLRGEFNKEMSAMFTELMKMSARVEKNLAGSTKTKAKLRVEVQNFIDSLIEGFRASPVAIYVNWRDGRVGGRPFMEVTSELMGHLRYNGFGTILYWVDKLIGLIVSMS